jgi:hypothetical protein
LRTANETGLRVWQFFHTAGGWWSTAPEQQRGVKSATRRPVDDVDDPCLAAGGLRAV